MSVEDTSAGSISSSGGFTAFLGGIGFVVTTPSVWPFACVPVFIAMVLMCALGGVGVWGARELSLWLIDAEGGQAYVAGQWLVTVLVALVFLVGAMFLSLVLAQPLSGWALEAIARRQERALTGRWPPDPRFLTSLGVALRCSLFTLVVGVFLTGSLFLVGLVFPPALVVTVPLKLFIVAWLLAWDFIDYPLGLRGCGIRARLAWVRRHPGAFTLFGLSWAVVLLVPGVALLVLPMGVAGATRMVVASDACELLEAVPA